jgi:hypothetical protein
MKQNKTTEQVLHPAENIFGYGLKMPNNEVKNFLMTLQAYFLKNLLFGKKMRSSVRCDFLLFIVLDLILGFFSIN